MALPSLGDINGVVVRDTREDVAQPGKTMNWNEMSKHAARELLRAKQSAQDVKDK